MRRFGIWLFNTALIVSLLLPLATIALWVRSHKFDDRFNSSDHYWSISSSTGRLWITTASIAYWEDPGFRSALANPAFDRPFRGFFTVQPAPGGHLVGFCGFAYLHYLQGPANPPNSCWLTYLGLPFWFILLIELAPGVAWRWMRHARPRPGTCTKCGYNLTGNISGICPECGTAIAKSAEAT